MFAKGRVKWFKKQLLSLLKQLFLEPFDERSEPETPVLGFRVSARDLGKIDERSASAPPCLGVSGLCPGLEYIAKHIRGIKNVIQRNDILSMEYLKKTTFTGCHQGMRYRLEGAVGEDGGKKLRCTIWPEPFNFFSTPQDEKETEEFAFEEDGVADAVAWMNERFTAEQSRWAHAGDNWDGRR